MSGFRLLLLVLLLTPGTWHLTPLLAQQPQAQQGQPLFATNAKYVNGVAPGYWPTQGSGLTLNLSAGTVICGNSVMTYAGGTLSMTGGATNYVYLDTANSCAPTSSAGSSFPATGIPIAVVTASGSAITAVSDVRTWFAARPVADTSATGTTPGATVSVGASALQETQPLVCGAAFATGSNTAGIQECINAAGTNGSVVIPPGTYTTTAQIVVQKNNFTISAHGAVLTCNVAATCLMVGNPVNGTWYTHITVEGLTLSPGANSAGYSAIEDNAQGTHFVDIKPLANSSYTFGNFMRFDDDQAAKVDKLNFDNQNVLSCTASACGAAIYSPQGAAYAALLTVEDSNLSMGCHGNPINWGSGPLRVVGSILQAYQMVGLLAMADQSGGLNQIMMEGGDNEVGNCSNPIGNVGQAGVVVQGRSFVALNTALGGKIPIFPQNGTTGSTFYQYYIVPHSQHWTGSVMPIGYITNGNATIDSTNNVTVTWPAISDGAILNYDLLVVKGNSTNVAPTGTGNYAVATGLLPANVCTSTLCTYTDTGTRSSYAITGVYSQQYLPSLTFWPAQVVLTVGTATNNCYLRGSYFGDNPGGGVILDVPTACSINAPHVYYTGNQSNYTTDYLPYVPLADRGLDPYIPTIESPALLLPSAGATEIKGRINLGSYSQSLGPATDMITITDSNYDQTLVNRNHRPSAGAGDAAICRDVPYAGSLCLRSPTTLSFYINKLPGLNNWDWQMASTGIAPAIPHFGLKTISTGAPGTPTLADVSSLNTCLTSHYYQIPAACYDGANFQLVLLAGTTGATAPTWSTTPGQATNDGTAIWRCLGPGTPLSANTTYHVKVAGGTLAGNSLPSSEASVTTANDGANHIILASHANLTGATSYQVGCSTTTGNEALLSAPFTGAYTGNTYALPVMSCSGSGSFNATDTTGYASFPGMFLGGGTAVTAMNLYSTASITPTAVGGASCSDQTFAVTGLLTTDRVSNLTPPSALGNVSVNGYASASNTVLLHFCNPSSSSVTPPAGVYSFLAVH